LVTCFYRRLSHAVAIAFAVGFAVAAEPAKAEVAYTVLSFDELEGWAEDDYFAALTLFHNTCRDMDYPDYPAFCVYATAQPDARAFVELLFRPVLIEDGNSSLFTGYFEPELNSSRQKTSRYRYPVYAMLPEARRIRPWLNRRDILKTNVVNGRGLKIAWVDDPVDGGKLLFNSPLYELFRNLDQVPAHMGPLGATNRSITKMRIVAVGFNFVKLGSLLWLGKDGENPMRRLTTAQDTGSSIKGAQRADVFVGTGDEAGRKAGRFLSADRMMALMPIQRAYALLSEDS